MPSGVCHFRCSNARDGGNGSLWWRWWRPSSSEQFRHDARHIHPDGNWHVYVRFHQPQQLCKPDIASAVRLPTACPLSLVSWYLTPRTGNSLSALVMPSMSFIYFCHGL